MLSMIIWGGAIQIAFPLTANLLIAGFKLDDFCSLSIGGGVELLKPFASCI